jgi:predicted phage terminase large subunit-like protein
MGRSREAQLAKDLQAAERELALLIGGRESLRAFIARVAPHHPPPRHLEPLITLIERARWERIRACVSMPPRHAKTITILRAIAWWLMLTPADTCAYTSYSDRQAWSKSRIARGLAQQAGVRMGDSETMAEWRTSKGGGMLATGAGGGLTGQGVSGLMVVDDPYKLREEAESPVIREKVWDWFTDVVDSRLEGASVLVVHTRWVQDDLIGRLAGDHGWEHVNLAALAEHGDPLGRSLGEALWPDRFPVEELQRKKSLNAYSFASLYQGAPRPRGATVFKEPHYYPATSFDLTGCRIVLYADPAASAKTTADHSVVLALAVKGYGAEMRGWILDVYRRQVTIPQFVRDLMDFQARHGNGVANVESVGAFKAVAQMLREIDPNVMVKEVTPLGDKFQRAQPAASAWNDGRILVPNEAPWLKAFLAEMATFTGVNDPHDDQVDCLDGAWNEADSEILYIRRDKPTLLRRR